MYVAIAVSAVIVAAIAFFATRPPRADAPAQATSDPAPSSSGSGMELVFMAAMNAPEGSTPCDSAYNALLAFQAKLRDLKGPEAGASMRPPPERAQFLASCTKLPDTDQPCMIPKYQVSHHEQCDPVIARASGPDSGAAGMLPLP